MSTIEHPDRSSYPRKKYLRLTFEEMVAESETSNEARISLRAASSLGSITTKDNQAVGFFLANRLGALSQIREEGTYSIDVSMSSGKYHEDTNEWDNDKYHIKLVPNHKGLPLSKISDDASRIREIVRTQDICYSFR